MKPTPCPRSFEAEAMRDGRLTGAERVGFERHTTMCPVCSREVRALEALADALHATPQEHATEDELRVRRERTRLLAAFDRTLVAPDRRWGSPRRLLWPAAAAALVACLFLLVRGRAAESVPRSNAIVRANVMAMWSTHMEDDRERVVLERGALWIHVTHPSGGRPLLVVLPDGELEDVGTTFTVSAEDGRTARVAVEEGRVLLRIRGRAPVIVGAGETWLPVAPASASAGPTPALPTEPAVRAAVATPSHTPGPRSSPPVASELAPDASADFRAAMAALDGGDNRRAAAAFASFVERHPRDPRTEDADYLRVIALQRGGDTAAMKEAALEYLRRHPAGFRYADVETLSR